MPRMTEAELLAYQTRQRQPLIQTEVPTIQRESELHNQIAEFCARNGFVAFHGSTAHRTHRTLGEPDFIVVAEGYVYFVECKRPGQKLRPDQLAIDAALRRNEHALHVVTSLQEFIEVLTPPNKRD